MNKYFRFLNKLAPSAIALLIFNFVTFPSGAQALTVKPPKPHLKAIHAKAHLGAQSFNSTITVLMHSRASAGASLMAAGAFGKRVALKPFDLTRTVQAKTSRKFRESLGVELWVSSWTAQKVSFAESRNNCRDRSSSGTYLGKWQMDSAFWSTYGGLKYASSADMATCKQQDQVAYNGWISRHWQPWQTYSLFSN